MKVIKNIIIAAIIGFAFWSCHSLDLDNPTLITEDELFQTASGIQKYLTPLYVTLPTEHFNYFGRNGGEGNGLNQFNRNNAWEATKHRLQNMSGEFMAAWGGVNNDGSGYWPYDDIRVINNFITKFPEYKEFFQEKEYKDYWGEAHFLRAFYYFALAIRYGGVPIITEVQDVSGDPATLAVSRATEYDTWKFIHDDLQVAIDNMTSTRVDRGSRYAAAALMSRAMLYAGTIAKYSSWLGFESEVAYQQGLAGISADKADEFFRWSVEASELILAEGPYELYAAGGADGAGYAELFRDISSKENIFIKCYITGQNDRWRHNWSTGMLPVELTNGGVGQVSHVSLDVLRMFGFPDIVDANGYPVRYDSPGDIRKGFDFEPRMRGNVWLNGDNPFNALPDDPTYPAGTVLSENLSTNKELNCVRGCYKTFTWKGSDVRYGNTDDIPNKAEDVDYTDRFDGNKVSKVSFSNRILNRANDNNAEFFMDGQFPIRIDNDKHKLPSGTKKYRYSGLHGGKEDGQIEKNAVACTWPRKYVTAPMHGWHVDAQHWIIFRLGEVYVNLAEAYYELGEKDKAFDYIEVIRKRAGSKVTRPAIDTSPYNGQPGALFNAHTYPMSIDASLQFIREERYRELYAENQRWWDLRRWRILDIVYNNYQPRALSCYYILDEQKYIYLDERTVLGEAFKTAGRNAYYEGIPAGEINKNPNLLPQNPLR